MRPFLLHLKDRVGHMDEPNLTFDENLSLNVLPDSGHPFVADRLRLATRTKTAAAPESDDEDVDDTFENETGEVGLEQEPLEPNRWIPSRFLLATMSKTDAKNETDDAD